MWDYISAELPSLIAENFNIDMTRQSITGHSMGGHGALTLALSNPGHFVSVSAFAPICNPMKSDWGRKQFEAYLGNDHSAWEKHDATVLMRSNGTKCPVLIDTGTDDQFYDLLGTSAFASAVADQKVEASIRLQKGYDHSYFFISTFIPEHIEFHANALAHKYDSMI
jgi:S-formylglutathione hydrolase